MPQFRPKCANALKALGQEKIKTVFMFAHIAPEAKVTHRWQLYQIQLLNLSGVRDEQLCLYSSFFKRRFVA